jgi:hypothetical protein
MNSKEGSSAPLTTRIKEQLDFIVSDLRKIFEKHKNRSKSLNKIVTDIVGQIVGFYRKVLIRSPAHQKDEHIPKIDVLGQSVLFTFSTLTNLKNSAPFFDLLECIAKMLIFYILTLEELQVLTGSSNGKLLAVMSKELQNRSEKSFSDFHTMEKSEDVIEENTQFDPMTEQVGIVISARSVTRCL